MLKRGACWEVLEEAKDGGEGAGIGVTVMMVMVVEEQEGRMEAVSVSPPSSIELGRCVRLFLSVSLSFFPSFSLTVWPW